MSDHMLSCESLNVGIPLVTQPTISSAAACRHWPLPACAPDCSPGPAPHLPFACKCRGRTHMYVTCKVQLALGALSHNMQVVVAA